MPMEFSYRLAGNINLGDIAIKSIAEKKDGVWELSGSLLPGEMLEVRQIVQVLMDRFNCTIPEDFPMINSAVLRCVPGRMLTINGDLGLWQKPFAIPELNMGPMELEFFQSLVKGEEETELHFTGKASFASWQELLGEIIFLTGEQSGIAISLDVGENKLSLDELLEKCLGAAYPEGLFPITINGGRVYYLHTLGEPELKKGAKQYAGDASQVEDVQKVDALVGDAMQVVDVQKMQSHGVRVEGACVLGAANVEEGGIRPEEAGPILTFADYPQTGLNIDHTMLTIHEHPFICSMRIALEEKVFEVTGQAQKKLELDCIELIGPDLRENVGPVLDLSIDHDPQTNKCEVELALVAGLQIFNKNCGQVDIGYSISERHFEGDFIYDGEILGIVNPEMSFIWKPGYEFHLAFPSFSRIDLPYVRMFKIARKVLTGDIGFGQDKRIFKEIIHTHFSPKLIFQPQKKGEADPVVENQGVKELNFRLDITYTISIREKVVVQSMLDLPMELDEPENVTLHELPNYIWKNIEDNLHLIAVHILSNPKEAAAFFGAVTLGSLPRLIFSLVVNYVFKGKLVMTILRLVANFVWPVVRNVAHQIAKHAPQWLQKIKNLFSRKDSALPKESDKEVIQEKVKYLL